VSRPADSKLFSTFAARRRDQSDRDCTQQYVQLLTVVMLPDYSLFDWHSQQPVPDRPLLHGTNAFVISFYACSDTYCGMARAGTWNPTCSQTSLQRAFPDARTAFVRLVRVSVLSFSPLCKALQVVISIIWSKNSLFDNCWVLWLWSDRY
jgi:hypothetical protein